MSSTPQWREASAPTTSGERWGRIDGKDVWLHTLENAGITLRAMSYGAIITHLLLPDARGRTADVVHGFDSLDGYIAGHPYFGAIVGRDANRTAAGRFTIDGHTYQLARNNKPNHLHGGVKGFDKHVWDMLPVRTPEGPGVEFTRTSPDGEENYPGTLEVKVRYVLRDDRVLRVDIEATTSRPTPVDITQHTYFNLAGHDAGSIRDHELMVHASGFTPVGEDLIPTGAIQPVEGTAYDFRSPKTISTDLDHVGGDPAGYDHNYAIDGDPLTLRDAAELRDPASGRGLRLRANQPGLQLYTSNFLAGEAGKAGAVYARHSAVCLEPQAFPDAINRPGWMQGLLRPGERYHHAIEYHFFVD